MYTPTENAMTLFREFPDYPITFGVSTNAANLQALQLTLASVLTSRMLPTHLLIRLEGDVPGLNSFYFEQLVCLARFWGIDVQLSVCNSQGVRAARDWLMAECKTSVLWMGDDDVLYHPNCLANLHRYYRVKGGLDVYFCGSKADLNNRRGYQNFNMQVNDPATLEAGKDTFNWLYAGHPDGQVVGPHPITTCDTGNCLMDLNLISEHHILFSVFWDSVNSGGEDTIFALQCQKHGLKAYYSPSAWAFHLEKPDVRFNEFAARGEMILRACDVLGLDKSSLANAFMPWLKLGQKQ